MNVKKMAYVFGFNKDITDIIYSFRDWKLEEVKRYGGTPSRLALKPYKIMKNIADPFNVFHSRRVTKHGR